MGVCVCISYIDYTTTRRCDGFIGFSNFTDHSVGAINIAHAGPESLYNMVR
jgi:hypothetical protein